MELWEANGDGVRCRLCGRTARSDDGMRRHLVTFHRIATAAAAEATAVPTRRAGRARPASKPGTTGEKE